jgi:3-oxoacyl-[acyl-carrier-protein] synthase II
MRRVAVTGVGMVTSVGSGRHSFWPALVAGQSGITPVQSFDTAAYEVHLGGEVRSFQPEPWCRRLDPSALGRSSQMAIAAARLALEDAGLKGVEVRSPDGARDEHRSSVGVFMGTTTGEPLYVEEYNDAHAAGDLGRFPERHYGRYPCSVIAEHVADELEVTGPCAMFPTACAAGNYAIAAGFDLIRTGRVERAVVGAADSFSRIVYTGFARLGAIAPDRCQPFDLERKGMIPGEGAAVLILESLDGARERGAQPTVEVLGCGLSCDAHHMTAPHPEGAGALVAMRLALRDGDVSASEVDYVCAHGTGTPNNDRVESTAIRGLLEERADRVPVSSIKSMLGHTMGAASAIEAVACVLALETGIVPPTMNFETPDPDCVLDCVPNRARRVDPAVVLSNAFAFGGNNATLCLGRIDR